MHLYNDGQNGCWLAYIGNTSNLDSNHFVHLFMSYWSSYCLPFAFVVKGLQPMLQSNQWQSSSCLSTLSINHLLVYHQKYFHLKCEILSTFAWRKIPQKDPTWSHWWVILGFWMLKMILPTLRNGFKMSSSCQTLNKQT